MLAALLCSGIHSVVGRTELDFLKTADGATGLRSGRAPPAFGDAAGEQRSDDKPLEDLQSVHVTALHESRWLESARGASGPRCGSPPWFQPAAGVIISHSVGN